MSNERILVVDDEEPIRELLRYNLEKDGFRVACCATGEEALARVRNEPPELILLDLMLPGTGGLDVCRRLKENPATADIPVIMITAKTEDTDVVLGLELGAEDYVTKPFSTKILLARVRTALRRKNRKPVLPEGERLSLHGIVIDPERHEVFSDSIPVALSVTEFEILSHLVRNPGRVLSRTQIISAVKGESYPVTERSIDVQILSIRKKLGEKADVIETVRGIGYRMKDPE